MFMYTDYTQHLLDNVKKIHFIGCGGSGMYPLIQILAAKGYDISGSDVLDGSIIRSEREMGVKVTLGHSADNVIGADLVVYSAAIAKDNVELNAAASYGITTVERSVLLGYVSRLYKQSICVSGTHGKTTTTSMITTALELAGRDPSAVIGGKLPLIHGYGRRQGRRHRHRGL
jgi:murC: UDP-N-acetylmuramate--alanine ligase